MRECVVVPTYQRPDFLFLCLEAIRVAEDSLPIHVFPDRGTDESSICERFGATQHLTLQHSYHGNSYNVMEALRWAYVSGYERVFIVEDDAIVDRTFFDWSRAALGRHPDSFAACGWQYSPQAIISDGPDLRMPWYLSVCVALPRKSLYGIACHARPEYYGDMKGYLDRAYPTSHHRFGGHFEQDGLALRVCEAAGLRCIWPRRPRALHIGFTGYHMPGKPLTGTLEERVARLRLAISDPAILKSMLDGDPAPETSACAVCGKPLLADKSARAVCCACFHQQFPGLPVTTTSFYYFNPSGPQSSPSSEGRSRASEAQ